MATYKPATEETKKQLGDALGPEGSYYDAVKQAEPEKTWPDGLYPIFIVVLYLLLGFLFKLWHPGWLIFFAIPLYYMRPKTPLLKLCNPVMITLIYLVLGFFFHLWHPGWLIFFAIPAAYILDAHDNKQKKAQAE